MRRLQLLLSEGCRSRDARTDLVQTLESLGCTVTGVGEVSLSVRVSETVFQKVFRPAPPQVPPSLEPWLASVAEAPVHQSFDRASAAGAKAAGGDGPDAKRASRPDTKRTEG